jgi:hypothetical protein
MRRTSFIAMFALALLAAWRPVHSESFEIPMELHKQRGDFLCWAATSASVVQKILPMDSALRGALRGAPVDQFAIAALGKVEITEPGAGPHGFDTRRTTFITQLSRCRDVRQCDQSAKPLLFGLQFKTRARNAPLSEEQLRKEIVDFKRPVMTTWVYEDPRTADWGASKHELIIFGFRVVGEGKGKVQFKFWNPLPVDRTGTQPTRPSTQLGTWRPYDYYTNPEKYYSRPVWRSADAFEIEAAATTVVGTWPKPFSPPAPPLNKVDFTVARRAFEAGKARLLSDYIADYWPDPAASPGRPSFAEPFLIVAPTIDELLAARGDPARVLVESTSGLVVPVIQDGQVVDSLLYSNSDRGWIASGFSNVDVDRILVALRSQHPVPPAAPGGQPDSFYMVAIPEASAFFAARGFGRNAQLIPVSEGGASPGPGDKLLGQVIKRIETEIARYHPPGP